METIDNELLLIAYYKAIRAVLAMDQQAFKDADASVMHILSTCKVVKNE